MPVNEESLAGWVAVHGAPLVLEDAYALPEGAPYHHNDAFDVATGFRTRAMLVVPMNDHRGELVGVLQLMNRVGPRRDRSPIRTISSRSSCLSRRRRPSA